ncbi:4635_t:CDS:2 [Funneliformis geosporum]|nr:4635_t:CDS:2 [Funneliformis geosporum]
MITERRSVLCVCILCRHESSNSGKYVSTATRTRHQRREKTFNNHDISASYNGNITRIESTDIGKNVNQYVRSEMMEEDILYYDVTNNDDYEDTIAANIILLDDNNTSDGDGNNEEEYDTNENDDGDEREYDYDSEEEYVNEGEYDSHEEYHNDKEYDKDEDDNDEECDSDKKDDNNELALKEFNLLDNLIKGLQLLYIKEKITLSNKVFNEIMIIFGLLDVSLFKLRKNLENIIPIKPKLVDMCWNSCCAYIGKNSAAYFSVIDSLRIQYKDPSRAMILQYQHEYTSSEEYISNNDKIGDVIDGNRYKSLSQEYDRTNYNPENLPMRIHINYLQDIEAIENEIGGARTRIQSTQLCLEPVIFKQELEEIQTHFVGFVHHYENEYYQRDSDRLPATLISFHYLLYIMKSIQETGPPWLTWQFLIERLCGMLIPLKIFSAFQKETKILPLEHAFRFSATEEELHSPSQKYNMIKTDVRKVKQHYDTTLDLMMNEVGEIIEHIQKYGKLRTKSEVLINSKLVNRKGDVTRNNYSIAAKLLVDKNAHLPKAHYDFEEREFYSQVLYYFVHEFNNKLSMLAFVQWIRRPEILGNNIQYFHNIGETSVINVTAIDQYVGFLENLGFISKSVDDYELILGAKGGLELDLTDIFRDQVRGKINHPGTPPFQEDIDNDQLTVRESLKRHSLILDLRVV